MLATPEVCLPSCSPVNTSHPPPGSSNTSQHCSHSGEKLKWGHSPQEKEPLSSAGHQHPTGPPLLPDPAGPTSWPGGVTLLPNAMKQGTSSQQESQSRHYLGCHAAGQCLRPRWPAGQAGRAGPQDREECHAAGGKPSQLLLPQASLTQTNRLLSGCWKLHSS